jgi:hypothetical protein
MILLAVLAALLQAPGDVDESLFRYTRPLDGPAGAAVRFEPDARMYGHTRPGFADLRILDAADDQVPWRLEPKAEPVPRQEVALVARGRRGDVVSVVVDRGAVRPVIDRMELEIPDDVFVGEVVVRGSNTGAEGSYALLSRTPIYAVRGAVDARSTTAVFPPTDYRFLHVDAQGVSEIAGASVLRDPESPPLQPVAAKATRTDRARATVVVLDLGFRNVPVAAIRIRSTTPRFVRSVTVEGSNDGVSFVPLGGGEVARFDGVELSQLRISATHRHLRVTIRNGDDSPLEGLEVVTEAESRPLLLAEGNQPPFRLLYGSGRVSAPAYDFAQLPATATGFEQAREGSLGPERANELFEPPAEVDTRTFFERYDALVEGALVLAAIVVAAGGVLALRRRTSASS